MKVQYDVEDMGDSIRLVIGWTAIIGALLIFAFHPPTAGFVLTIGVWALFPLYYSRLQNKPTSRNEPRPSLSARREQIDRSRREQAIEYRGLFEEGIISRDEYHDAVGRLYPELERGPSQETTNAQQVEAPDAE